MSNAHLMPYTTNPDLIAKLEQRVAVILQGGDVPYDGSWKETTATGGRRYIVKLRDGTFRLLDTGEPVSNMPSPSIGLENKIP